MGEVFSIETGKKISDDEIAKIIKAKTNVEPIPKEEVGEISSEAEKMAEELLKSLEEPSNKTSEKT